MRIALVHDWFIGLGGSEQVFKQILACYPNADIFCLIDHLNPNQREYILQGKKTNTSFLQRLPFSKRIYRYFLPLFRRGIESFDLSGYDLIISSSHAVAKGVITGKDQMHICYCHTPMRYAWDLKTEYLKEIKSNTLRKRLSAQLDKIKKWDLETASNVNYFIANSKYIAKRIKKNYKREAHVIYPSANTNLFVPNNKQKNDEGYAIVVSRMVPYKKLDIILNAYAQLPNHKLKIVGTGPMRKKLEAMASPNVEIMPYQPFKNLVELIKNADFFILAANEDFGITSIEAQACGIPVLALEKGGYLESVVADKTGVFYSEQTSESIAKGVLEISSKLDAFDKETIRANAELFSEERFRMALKSFVDEKLVKA